MTTFETSRLTLRSFAESDVDFVFDLYSRWDVMRYIGVVPRVMEHRSEAETRIAASTRLDQHPVHGIWAVESRDTGAPVGVMLLKPISVSAGEIDTEDIEIGWHFHPDAWGNGFATEAGVAILKHAFASGLERVVAVTNPENSASRRVAERLGMTYRGSSTRYYNTTVALFEISSTAA